MTSPCTCDCGFTTDDGILCLDWTAAGMHRVCDTVDGIAGAFQSTPAFALQREGLLSWTNTTCRTHRVIANFDAPAVKIKVGGGNAWYVRGYIDGAINAAAPATNLAREPEMQWSANWYNAMPAGTDQEAQAPGSAEREFLVQPGSTVNVAFRMFARTANYTAQAANRLEISTFNVSLSAWPSKTTAGSGLTC